MNEIIRYFINKINDLNQKELYDLHRELNDNIIKEKIDIRVLKEHIDSLNKMIKQDKQELKIHFRVYHKMNKIKKYIIKKIKVDSIVC